MKKTFISILAFCFVTITLFAQKDTIYYEEVRDEPYEIPNLYLSIVPLNINYCGNFHINFGANFQWNIIKQLSLRGNFGMQYPIDLDNLFGSNKLVSQEFNYANTNFRNFEIGLDFAFSDNVRTEDGTVLIKSNRASVGNVTLITNHVIQTKVQHRRINKIRLGVMQYMLNFYSQNARITTTDGTIFNADDLFGGVKYPGVVYDSLLSSEGAIGSYNENQYSEINSNMKTQQKISIAYLGFSVNNIKNKVIKVQDFGLRGIVSYTSFYCDLMFGKGALSPFQFFGSYTNANIYGEEIGTNLIEYNIDLEKSDLKFNPVGLRLGYSIKRPLFSKLPNGFENKTTRVERPVYLSYFLEAGLMPSYGIKRGIFLSAGLAVDINPL